MISIQTLFNVHMIARNGRLVDNDSSATQPQSKLLVEKIEALLAKVG